MACGRRPDRLALAAAAVVLASLLALPAVRSPLAGGAARLADVDPAAVAGGGIALLLAQAAAALAWRAALRACGQGVSLRQAVGCYGAGSLANSLLPGGAGDALRIELFARATGENARWLCGGVCAGINAGRAVVFAALLVGGVAGGLLPAEVLLAPLAGLAAIGVAATLGRRRGGTRLGEVARGATSITPAAIGWLSLVLALRFGSAVYLLHSFSVARPATGAIVLLTALGASSFVTLTPGNVGIASAAVAVALAHAGIEPGTAAAVGIAYHALETCAGLAFGACGFLLRAERLEGLVSSP